MIRALASLLALLALSMGIGCDRSARTTKVATPTRASPTVTPSAEGTVSAQRARLHAEILREIIVVLTGAEPADRTAFGSLVDSMNQGASYEGIVNGLILSKDFYLLERESPLPLKEAREVLGREFAALRLNASALGARSFIGLKRAVVTAVLNHLSAVEGMSSRTPAEWYAEWVVGFSARNAGLDLGATLRSSRDMTFHRRWFETQDGDLWKWEVVNRLLRAANAKQGQGTGARKER